MFEIFTLSFLKLFLNVLSLFNEIFLMKRTICFVEFNEKWHNDWIELFNLSFVCLFSYIYNIRTYWTKLQIFVWFFKNLLKFTDYPFNVRTIYDYIDKNRVDDQIYNVHLSTFTSQWVIFHWMRATVAD